MLQYNCTTAHFYRCNHWRTRDPGPYICDVYDGTKWEMMIPWLDEEGCVSLMAQFNIDWFNPHTHIPYSFGAVYCSILNLPREIRFLEENVLLLGEIPYLRSHFFISPLSWYLGQIVYFMYFFLFRSIGLIIYLWAHLDTMSNSLGGSVV